MSAVKPIAVVLNALVILLGAANLMQGNVCGAIVGFGAGVFNLITLLKSEAPPGLAIAGYLLNALAIIAGIVGLFSTYGLLFGAESARSGSTVTAVVTLVGSIALILAGVLTGIVVADDRFG